MCLIIVEGVFQFELERHFLSHAEVDIVQIRNVDLSSLCDQLIDIEALSHSIVK